MAEFHCSLSISKAQARSQQLKAHVQHIQTYRQKHSTQTNTQTQHARTTQTQVHKHPISSKTKPCVKTNTICTPQAPFSQASQQHSVPQEHYLPPPPPSLNCKVAARCRLGRAATSQFREGEGEGGGAPAAPNPPAHPTGTPQERHTDRRPAPGIDPRTLCFWAARRAAGPHRAPAEAACLGLLHLCLEHQLLEPERAINKCSVLLLFQASVV